MEAGLDPVGARLLRINAMNGSLKDQRDEIRGSWGSYLEWIPFDCLAELLGNACQDILHSGIS